MEEKVAQIIQQRTKASKKSIIYSWLIYVFLMYLIFKDATRQHDNITFVIIFLIFAFIVLIGTQIFHLLVNNLNYPAPNNFYRRYNRFLYIRFLGANKLLNKIDLGMQATNAANQLTSMWPNRASLTYSLQRISLDALDIVTDSRFDTNRAEGLIIEKYFQMKNQPNQLAQNIDRAGGDQYYREQRD